MMNEIFEYLKSVFIISDKELVSLRHFFKDNESYC